MMQNYHFDNMINRNRSLFISIIIFFCFLIAGFSANAQVQIGANNYSNLRLAFAAINSGTHTGNIVITINGNVTETSTAYLMPSGNGSANYNSVTVYPTGAYTISGSVYNALIEIRGADNVTIDGRINQAGTTNSLTLNNTYSSTSSAVWVDSLTSGVGGAAHNVTIRNCNIIGYATTSGSSFGIVSSSSSGLSSGGNGNDSLQILYNTFKKVYYGVRILGVNNAGNSMHRFLIKGNTFGSTNDNETVGYYPIYIQYGRYAEISDNTLFNINPTSGSYPIYLYYFYYSKVHNNQIINTTAISQIYGIFGAYNNSSTISNNTIRGLTSTSSEAFGIYQQYASNLTVKNNNISNLGSFYGCQGFYNIYDTNSVIDGNKIYTLRSNNTGSSYQVIGINSYYSKNTTIFNNEISDLKNGCNNTSNSIIGFQMYNDAGAKLYYNSVHLYGNNNGTNTSSGYMNMCMYFYADATNAASAIYDIRNNSFANSSVYQGTSSSYFMLSYFSGTVPTNLTMDYNNYYIPPTYGYIGIYNNSFINTFATWRTNSGKDANTQNVNPSYCSNLSLMPAPSSPLLAHATPITNFTLDRLNNSRSSTAPTIGAYEVTGDIGGPEISYTALTKTISLANRNLDNVVITDLSGVNTTTGTKPRLYYKKKTNGNVYNSNVNSTDGWKYVEASNTSSPFSFTIDYAKVYGGVAAGDIIQYFVIAQDLAATPNVSVNSANCYTDPTSVALTSANFPVMGTINNYPIGTVIPAGNIYVGNAETYKSLTAEGGLFQVIGNGYLGGSIDVYVTSNLTNETGEYPLMIDEQGSGNYHVRIKPSAAENRTISGTATGRALITLMGADRVSIDGRYDNNGTYFTIQNNGNSNSPIVQFCSIGIGAGCTYDTLRNCNLIGGSATNGYSGIVLSGASMGTNSQGYDNEYICIYNNTISKIYTGIYIYGMYGYTADYIDIKGNIIGAPTKTNSVSYYAMYVVYANNLNFSENEIRNMDYGSFMDLVYISSYVTNSRFSRNIIHDISESAPYRMSAFYISSTSSCNVTIDNNIIYNMINNGQYSSSYPGAAFNFYSGSGYNVYNNTVYLTGNRDTYNTSYKAVAPSACVYISPYVTGLDLRNNIFINKQVAPTNNALSYAIYNAGTSTAFSNADYNNYYVAGSQAMLTYYSGSNYSSLANWQSVIGRDYNTSNQDIEFMSETDFHLNGSSVGNPSLLCPAISGITTDMDGETRRTSNVNKGADEVRPTFTFSPDLNQYSGVFCNGDIINFTYTPTISFGDNIDRKLGAYQPTYSWFRNNNQISGETKTTLDINPVTAANAGTYFGRVSFMGDNTNTRNSVITVDDPISIVTQPESVILCKSAGKHTLSAGAIGTISNYKWQKFNTVTGQFNDISGQTESTYTVNLNTLDVLQPDPQIFQGVYRAVVVGPGNCGPAEVVSDPVAITCFAPITNLTVTSNRPSFNPCLNKEFRMTVAAQGTIYGYQWQKAKNNVYTDIPLDMNPTAQDETFVINSCTEDHSGVYRVVIYGSDYCGNEKVTSVDIKVKILVPIEIISEPENETICEGEEASLGVVADGTVYSYKWYLDGVAIDTIKYPSAAKAFYFIEDAKYEQSGLYTCRLSVEDCDGERFLYTKPVLVSVNAKTDITRQPKSQAKALGETAVFEFDSHVLGHLEDFQLQPTIQWYKVTGSPSTTITMNDEYGVNGRISGTKSNIMTITNVQDDDYKAQYYAVITGYCGTSITNYCNIVKPGEIIVNLAPQDQEICAKDTATVALIAESSIAGVDVLYQWFFKGQAITDNDKYEGTKTNVLLVKDIENSDAGLYTVKLTLSNGDPAKTTLQAVLTVSPELDVISRTEFHPTYKETETMQLWGVAVGSSDIKYQWFKDGVEIAGATSSSYTKTDIKTNDAGDYELRITDNICKDEIRLYFSVTVTTINVSGVNEAIAGELTLLNNTPNPFESVTEISFISAISQEVKLVISDIYGREVSTLFNGNCKVGLNQFKFDSALQNLTTGTYSYTLIANGKAITKKMILIK